MRRPHPEDARERSDREETSVLAAEILRLVKEENADWTRIDAKATRIKNIAERRK